MQTKSFTIRFILAEDASIFFDFDVKAFNYNHACIVAQGMMRQILKEEGITGETHFKIEEK